MKESDGEFQPAKESGRKCSACSSPMTEEVWESSCGGYEDYKYTCTNKDCLKVVWIDGIDS